MNDVNDSLSDSLGDYLSKPIGDIINDLKFYKQKNEFLKDNIDHLEQCLESINREIQQKQNCERNILLMSIISNMRYHRECSKSEISEEFVEFTVLTFQ